MNNCNKIIALVAVILSGCQSTPKVTYSPTALKYHNQCQRDAYQISKENQIKPQTPLEGVLAAIVEAKHRKTLYHNCMKVHN